MASLNSSSQDPTQVKAYVESRIAELRKQPGMENITAEDIDNMINLNRKFAEKAVLTVLLATLENAVPDENGVTLSKTKLKKLQRSISDRIPKSCGYTQVSFDDTEDKLNISLAKVASDYAANVWIPENADPQEILREFNMLKKAARSFWMQFTEENVELVETIKLARPDIQWCVTEDTSDETGAVFGGLTVDPKAPTTLYFDPKCEIRVGIFPYYVGPDGKLFFKKDR